MLTVARQLKRIAVSEENYRKLQNLGVAGESFNDVITRILERTWRNEDNEKKGERRSKDGR
mgnify:CR=1 FL=1